jgi:hypothetical protein
MDDDRGDGRWRARAVGVGHGASVCRHVRRSVWDRVEGVRVVASPSWPLGRSFRRSTPWRGASLPPGAGRDCLTDCPSSRDGEHRERRASVCRGRTVPGFMSDWPRGTSERNSSRTGQVISPAVLVGWRPAATMSDLGAPSAEQTRGRSGRRRDHGRSCRRRTENDPLRRGPQRRDCSVGKPGGVGASGRAHRPRPPSHGPDSRCQLPLCEPARGARMGRLGRAGRTPVVYRFGRIRPDLAGLGIGCIGLLEPYLAPEQG